jgi:hypothetical protein
MAAETTNIVDFASYRERRALRLANLESPPGPRPLSPSNRTRPLTEADLAHRRRMLTSLTVQVAGSAKKAL